MELKENRSGDLLFLSLAVVLGLILRLDFLLSPNFVVDSDEAIVGLMALHYTQGVPLPVFYYGQHYMGTLEPWVAGIFFEIFGPSSLALKTVPLLFSLVLIVLNYFLAHELAGRFAARCSALLTAVGPASLVVWSLKARGGFIEVVVLGTAALLLTSLWLKHRRGDSWRLFLIAVLLGFGWWTNNQVIFYMLPIGLLCFVRSLSQKSFLKNTIVGTLGFVLGGAPFWLYNITNEGATFRQLVQSGESDFFGHMAGFFEKALPILLGGRRFWQEEDLYSNSSLIVISLFGAAFLFALLRFFMERKKKPEAALPILLLLLFVVGTATIFSLSSFGYLSSAPRYLLPLYSAFAPLYGVAFASLARVGRASAMLGMAVVLGLHLTSCYLHGRAIPGEPFVYDGQRVSKDHEELLNWARAENIHWVQTNYWIGYRLAFESQESLKFVVFQAPHQTRISAYEQEAPYPKNRLPYVLVPAQTKLVTRALDLQGIRYKLARKSGYDIVYNLTESQDGREQVSRSELKVSASSRFEMIDAITDGDEKSRWGSGEPQHPGMFVRVTFAEPLPIHFLRYSLGGWTHDYPRALKVSAHAPDSPEDVSILSEQDFLALRYLDDSGPWTIYFPENRTFEEVVLIQTGSDSFFDWSIAELSFYERSSEESAGGPR
ncbi:MAG: glycosyltransferase family 39 protein [Bdellovibrionales bacterium]|nr:glycosyltransferase family 39 protein [Bdellovibrionales bacterium]